MSRSVRWRRRCPSTRYAYSPARLSLSIRGLKSPTTLRQCPVGRQCIARLPPSPSIVGRRKLSTRRWWSERNAPAGGFSTRAVFWPDRTPRSRPAFVTKNRLWSRGPSENRQNPAGIFRVSAPSVFASTRCSFNPARSRNRLTDSAFVDLHFKRQSM